VTWAIVSVVAGACQAAGSPVPSAPSSAEPVHVSQGSSPTPSPFRPVQGGCGATQLFSGPGPAAAIGLANNPWTPATPASSGIVAYFWHLPPAMLRVHRAGDDSSGGRQQSPVDQRRSWLRSLDRCGSSARKVVTRRPIRHPFGVRRLPVDNRPTHAWLLATRAVPCRGESDDRCDRRTGRLDRG
jgi:hypothetical protein